VEFVVVKPPSNHASQRMGNVISVAGRLFFGRKKKKKKKIDGT
jgi:hypothetical protein